MMPFGAMRFVAALVTLATTPHIFALTSTSARPLHDPPFPTLPLLVNVINAKRDKQRKEQLLPGERDLEMFLPSDTEKHLINGMFDVLKQEQTPESKLQIKASQNEGALVFDDLLSFANFVTNMPPIRRIADAIDNFKTFTNANRGSNKDRTYITAGMLIESYKDMFEMDLTQKDARDMMKDLRINKRQKKLKEDSIGLCEFVVGDLRRDLISDEMLHGTYKIYDNQSEWIYDNIADLVGNGDNDVVSDRVFGEVIFNLDSDTTKASENGGKTKMGGSASNSKFADAESRSLFTKCEFVLAVACIRDVSFRGFLRDEPSVMTEEEISKADLAPLALFENVRMFDNEYDAYMSSWRQHVEKLHTLYQIESQNGVINKDNFRRIIQVIDSWQDQVEYLPSMKKHGRVKYATYFNASILMDHTAMLNDLDPTYGKAFEKVWAGLAGNKSVYMTKEKWASTVMKMRTRAGVLPGEINSLSWWEQMDRNVATHLSKGITYSELKNAWYGSPLLGPRGMMNQKDIKDAVKCLHGPDDGPDIDKISRDDWLKMAPLFMAFLELDADKSGTLTLEEFKELGITVFTRLGNDPEKFVSLISDTEKNLLYNAALQEQGLVQEVEQENGSNKKQFRLGNFFSLFRDSGGGGKVILQSIVSPGKLMERRSSD